MEKEFIYSFDDEPVTKFCYSLVNRRIEIHFDAYYEVDGYIERPGTLIIENWKDAKSKIATEEKWCELDAHMGVFTIILSWEYKGEELEIFVNTVDNRYVSFLFVEPMLSMERWS